MLALLLAAVAQPSPPPPEQAMGAENEIVVTAESKPYQLSGRKLRAAMAAFAKYHARYAPAAPLAFKVRIARDAVPAQLHLDLVDDKGIATPVPIDPVTLGIILPPLPRGRFDLIGSAALRVEEDIRSPGTSETDRRLGDLRLACRAGMELIEVSGPIRALFDLAGGCASSRFGIYNGSRRTIATATVSEGARTLPLQITASRRSYRMPLADKSLSDEARVRLAYEK